jgi:UDP-N-acetylmuramoyl-tripeptide--D-alanyl-D-alanine ligase
MGKTTTREFTAQLLSLESCVHQTMGNFNNEIGLPLSLLTLSEEHAVSLIELGMNHSGEILFLGRLCEPDLALITNIAPVHLEFFADLDELADAKGEILQTLPSGGIFIYNRDDQRLCRLAGSYPGSLVSFGLQQGADYRITSRRAVGHDRTAITLEGRGGFTVKADIPLVGEHFMYNLLGGTAAACTLGLDPEHLREGLETLRPLEGRGQILSVHGVKIWDDTYNSSPSAVMSLLKTMARIDDFQRKILVLGDMLELGPDSRRFHKEVGGAAASANPTTLLTVGPRALDIAWGAKSAGLASDAIHHFEDSAAAAVFLERFVLPGDLVVVKGSRGMKMEHIVEALQGDLR